MTSSSGSASLTSLFKVSPLRLGVLLALVVIYLFAWRPARGYIAQELVKPPIERYVESQEGYAISGQHKSVVFTVYRLKPGETSWATPDNYDEFIFGTPWGFYLFFPLLFLMLIKDNRRLIELLTGFHLIAGLICIVAFMGALLWQNSLIHLYRMLTYYVVPGVSFLIIFIAFFRNKF